MSKSKQVIGWLTIAGVVGLTAYAIHEYRKNKKERDLYISIEEAREIAHEKLNKIKNNVGSKPEVSFEVDMEYIPEYVETENMNSKDKKVIIKDDKLEMDLEMPILEDDNILLEDEGDGTLRYDPNSEAALQQYIDSEIVTWADDKWTHEVFRVLFDIPFVPTNDGDRDFYDRLASNRENFFGANTMWSKQITFGDVVSHFAHHLDFNLNGSVKYWGRRLVILSGLADYIPNIDDTEQLEMAIEDMNNHVYFNGRDKKHGLFGLTDEFYDMALETASNNIDNELTYEIEYQTFLKQWQRDEL